MQPPCRLNVQFIWIKHANLTNAIGASIMGYVKLVFLSNTLYSSESEIPQHLCLSEQAQSHAD